MAAHPPGGGGRPPGRNGAFPANISGASPRKKGLTRLSYLSGCGNVKCVAGVKIAFDNIVKGDFYTCDTFDVSTPRKVRQPCQTFLPRGRSRNIGRKRPVSPRRPTSPSWGMRGHTGPPVALQGAIAGWREESTPRKACPPETPAARSVPGQVL